uniref:Condensin complex subunit 2 n=1 Tax=Heterorhabditis bacteriophora TaxID=37862 RepID=A0A1I7WRF3_HETBA
MFRKLADSATALVSSTTQPLQIASKENIVDKVALKHLTGKQDIPEAEDEEDVQAPQAAGGLTSTTTFAPLNLSKEDTLSILKIFSGNDIEVDCWHLNVIIMLLVLEHINPILQKGTVNESTVQFHNGDESLKIRRVADVLQ